MNSELLIKNCFHCGIQFNAIGSNRFKQRFCSRSCMLKNRYIENRESLLEKSRNFRKNNPEKVKQSVDNWRKNNHDRMIETTIRWQKNNPEKVKLTKKKEYQSNKSRYQEHSKKYREENRVELNEYSRNWRKNNNAKTSAYTSQRRALKLNATPIYADLKKIEEFYKEATRLTKETGIKHQVDHIIPLKGKLVTGFHHEGNLQILTAEQNRKKSNKFPYN